MNIHPSLLERLNALKNIFFSQWRQVPLYRYIPATTPAQYAPTPETNNNATKIGGKQSFADLVLTKDDDDGDEGEGGRGTATGLRKIENPNKIPTLEMT